MPEPNDAPAMTHIQEAVTELATAKMFLTRAIEDCRYPNHPDAILQDIEETERQIAFAKNSLRAHMQGG